MKLLLDTHVLLWWLAEDPALPARARALMASPESVLFVSAVSLWEIWLKVSLGKLRLPPDFGEVLTGGDFESLPLMAAHAKGIAELPWHHRDPFDRMLLAQARAESLTLLTADSALTVYGDCVLVV